MAFICAMLSLKNALCLTVTSMVFSLTLVGQGHLENVEKFQVGDNLHLISSIAISPNGETLAVARVQGAPLDLYDLKTESLIASYDVSNGHYAGPILQFSKTGKYLMLEQQFYFNWNENKDKAVKYTVIDPESGNVLWQEDGLQDAQVSPDETQLAAVKRNKVVFYDLPTGSKSRELDVEGLRNALCFNADGSGMFIAHKLNKAEAESVPTIRSDKKAVKYAVKFQEGVSLFDVNTLEKLQFFPESFDHVYDMKLNASGTKVYVFSKLSTKAGGRVNQGNVLLFDIASGQLERGGFVTNLALIDYGGSSKDSYFGIVSSDGRSKLPIVQVCDPENADILAIFTIDKGIYEGVKSKEFQGAQMSIDFSKDERYLFVSSGNVIYRWEIEY